MAALVKLIIPDATRAALKESLTPADFRKAEYQVVNRTLAKLVTLLKRGVKKAAPTVSRDYATRAITLIKAKGDPPVGAVIVNNKKIPLSAFRVSGFAPGRNGSGGEVFIAQGFPVVILRHGFEATGRSGKSEHDGIFLRARVPAGMTTTRGRHGEVRKYTPAGFAERLPIRQQWGPSAMQLVSIPEIMAGIDVDLAAEVQKQAASQLSRFTNPKAVTTEV